MKVGETSKIHLGIIANTGYGLNGVLLTDYERDLVKRSTTLFRLPYRYRTVPVRYRTGTVPYGTVPYGAVPYRTMRTRGP